MGRYVIRRLLQAVLTLFLALFLLHYLMALSIQINGNPARAFFGDKVTPTAAQLQAVKEAYNTDDPCLERVGDPCLATFVERLGDYARGDLGQTLQFRPVSDGLAIRVPITLRLFAISTVVWAVVGISFGVLAAMRREKLTDYLIRYGSLFATAVPVLLVIIGLKYIGGLWIGNWVRDTFGENSALGNVFITTYIPEHPWLSLLLPGVGLAALGTAGIIRLVRTGMLENMRADFVRTARAKGLPERRVTIVHTFRNSLIPVVTLIGLSFGGALGGAVITEGVWNAPGIGQWIFQAVKANDTPIVISVVTVLVTCYLGFSLIVDLLYAVLDPRIRYE